MVDYVIEEFENELQTLKSNNTIIYNTIEEIKSKHYVRINDGSIEIEG